MNWWKEKGLWIVGGVLLWVFICVVAIIGYNFKKCPTCPETERIYIGYPVDKTDDIVIDSIISKVRIRPYLKVYYHPEYDTISTSKDIVLISDLNPKSFNLADLMDVMQTYYRWGYDYTYFLRYLSLMHRDRRAIELCRGTGLKLNILWYNVNWQEMTGEK